MGWGITLTLSPTMTFDHLGNVFLAYSDQNAGGTNNGLTAYKFDGTTWNMLGSAQFTITTLTSKIAVDTAGVPYIAFVSFFGSDELSVV